MLITPIQTRWTDLDSFRHVNNVSYVNYLEIGRVDYCAKKFGVKEVMEVPFILARIEVDLLKSIELGDPVEVLTCVARIGNKSWEFESRVRNPNSKLVYAKARTVQVSFDYHNNVSIQIPERIRTILEQDLLLFQKEKDSAS
ncbi:thioesterase [Leptospira perolatii]|uniref:Thioesterase n=1 Tax=Leptospira perolatii TaxID=2023191 RepID=A0A2M9ZRV0_9LEPT|nr:acyl-CoA thioesterase [Leptospira perolatii]PJZ71222.1 thioesterase [Leptospira perolatii]PJZ74755.1 thioesterase [Leptospira perolatii]